MVKSTIVVMRTCSIRGFVLGWSVLRMVGSLGGCNSCAANGAFSGFRRVARAGPTGVTISVSPR